MPVSIREQLIQKITETVGGLYDIPAPTDEREYPVTIVRDRPEVAADDQYGVSNREIPVAIGRGAVSASTVRAEQRAEANELLADLVTEMFADEGFTSLADGLEYTGGGIQVEVGKFVIAEAQFTVRYHTVRGDPYTIDED